MKRLLIQIIFSIIIILHVHAQADGRLPFDPTVKKGVLDNGLTYYIKKNTHKEKRADFYIVQRVGSMQEEDNQSGLAHFLEHMAFNGTKHFPGRKTMLDYLERNGAKFGDNVNAYTSYDETVYNLSDISLTREGIIDSCLLILHDWSRFITLDDKEIDKERAIIKEEWRTRNGANERIWSKLFPIMLEGSKYANRNPIGDMGIVENFPYQVIKDYYDKWYRPDLQAVIIVGDIDPEEIERRIKELFADIPKPVNPTERIYYTVKDNKEPIIAIATDPEATSTSVSIYFKHDVISPQKRLQREGLKETMLSNMTGEILSSRLYDIAQQADAPFVGASAYDGQYAVAITKQAFTLAAGCNDGQIDKALTALLQEKKRLLQFGVVQEELDRYKLNVLQYYDQLYSNRDKQSNATYVQEYLRNFTQSEPVPGIEYEYALVNEIIREIDLQTLNDHNKKLFGNGKENVVVTVIGPEKAGISYPSVSEIKNIFDKVESDNLTAYTNTVEAVSLIDHLPQAGRIVKIDKNGKFGSIVWTLSNGIRVVLKKTEFKNDQIFMSGISAGGTSVFEDNEVLEAGLINAIPAIGGIGNFSPSDLNKILAGNSANVSTSVSQWTQNFSGSSANKDIETLFQLIYLYFTAPRQDNQAYLSFTERMKEQLKNSELDPSTAFNDSIRSALYMNSPRAKRLKYEDINKISYPRIVEMYKQCFSNPTSFTFVFTGSVDENVFRPFVEQYLGSFPVEDKNGEHGPLRHGMRKGKYRNSFTLPMQTPKASVINIYSGTIKRNIKNSIGLDILNQILDIVYTRTIREAEGGTYGVSTNISMRRIPDGETLLQISYTTDPSKVTDLNNIVHRELSRITESGPVPDDFNKVKEYLLKSYDDQKKQDSFWISHLLTYYFYKEDFYSDYYAILNSITVDDIRKITEELLSQENLIEVIMSCN